MRMTGYTKLFGSIITSTIWREKNETRILWITMLALKNKSGIVEGSIPGLADMARLSLEDTIEALETLKSPDPYSRTKEFEGRRIEAVDGGWLVLNHEKWRNKMNADERREYLKIKQREHRARVNKSVNKDIQSSTLSTHTDAYTKTKTEPEKKKRTPIIPLKGDVLAFFEDEEMGNDFFDYFTSNGWKVGGRAPMQDWKAAARRWKRKNIPYEPKMSPHQRQNRINYLNEKKQKTLRMIKDPNNPPSWAVSEIATIDAELQKL